MSDARDPADLPAWLPALLQTRQRAPQPAPANVELDTPAALRRAATYLKSRPPAVEGQGGDARTFQTIAAIHDFGISEAEAPDVLSDWNERCDPPWEPDELAIKIGNAYRYAQNEPGCYSVGGGIPEADRKS
ncbi:MAG: hypothetical protein JWP73_694, partial [Phenylobacterium sp.]|nr:hypothetical protein [Phenylobacterium sp.]